MSGPSSPLRLVLLDSIPGWGGGEKWCVVTGRALARRGHRVVVACERGSALDLRARDAGLDVLAAPFRGPTGLLGALRLGARCRREGLEAIVANVGRDLRAGVVARAMTPVRLIQRRGVTKPVRDDPLTRWIYRTRVDRIVVNSLAIRDAMQEGAPWLPDERFFRLPNAIDTSRPPPPEDPSLRRRLGLEDAPVVASIGRLSAMKGHRVLLDAWPEVRRTDAGRDARLLVVGAGEEGETLRERARGLDGVHFLGFRTDLDPVWGATDLLAMPSVRDEGCPNVVLEAMWRGIAVVATRCGGLPEVVIDGDTGRLVPVGEPHPLARAIVDLLGAPTTREALGQVGRERVRETYALDRVVDRFEGFLRELRTSR